MAPRASTGRGLLCFELLRCSCMHWGAPTSAPDRCPGPGIDFLQSSQAFQCLCPGGKASRSPLPPQPVPFVSSPLPFSQVFLGAAPPRLCQRGWCGLCQRHSLLCSCVPALLQRGALRPSDRHLDVHRCHEHQETLRAGGHARWVMARGPGFSADLLLPFWCFLFVFFQLLPCPPRFP